MRFICSDETINSYGFWVLAAGIDTSRFSKNPVMLWNHSRSYGSKDDVLPIGYWKDLRIENGQLTAEAVFDEKDDFARQIAGKVRDGVIRACSIGIRILSTSTEPQHLKPVQTRETVISCELREISLCDIPANGNAVALYDEHDELMFMGDKVSDVLPVLLSVKPNSKPYNMDKINAILGLTAGSSEEAAVAEIQKLRDQVAALEKARTEVAEAHLRGMVDEAVRQRKITEDKREIYMGIGRNAGAETLQAVLSELSAPARPSDLIRPSANNGDARKLSDCSAGELEDLRANDPQRYSDLFEAEYGCRPEL